jgi:MtrB/PioB family decaheme-associated outer membrane protein
MTTMNKQFGQKAMVLAIAAAFGPAVSAEEISLDAAAEYTQPSSSVSMGVGAASGDTKDRAIWGQYNGLREHDFTGLLDIDLVKRDEATGTWILLNGKDLGLDNRELSATYEKQGNWKATGSYNELTHHEFRTINTADGGVGSTNPSVVRLATPGTGNNMDFQLKRKGLGLGGEVWLTPSLLFEVNFKNENKDGSRFTGKGYDCAAYVCAAPASVTGAALTSYPLQNVKNAILMQAEPVNTNTKQVDMRLAFSDEKLNVNAGYYGSFFSNDNGSVNMTVPNVLNGGRSDVANPLYPATSSAIIAGGMSLQNALQLPFALPPDNQAHQFFVDGNYAFTKSTKANFKYAYTHATQDQSYNSMGLPGAPGNVSNLGGAVNTTLAQFSLSSRPMPKLSLLASVRYENKEDKTPKYLYNTEAQTVNPAGSLGTYLFTNTNQNGTNPASWYNGLTSGSKLNGKLEASYRLPEDFRGTIGFDYNKIEREVPTSIYDDFLAGISTVRAKSEESGYRLELSRMMSETLSGSISYANSRRRGSDWTSLSTLNPAVPGGLTAANLALVNAYCGGVACYGQQLSASSIAAMSATAIFPASMSDLNRDKWKLMANWNPMDRLSLQFIIEDGKDKNVTSSDSLAGAKGLRDSGMNLYAIDASFNLTDDWLLTGYGSYGKQSMTINHSTGYMLDLDTESNAFGLGIKGKVSGNFEIGANIAYLKDNSQYGLGAAGTATGGTATATNVQQAAIGLPNVEFNQTVFNLYGRYSIDKNSDIVINLQQAHAKLKEWSWGNNGVPFVYADNTTVSLQESQNVTFLGARYQYKFK